MTYSFDSRISNTALPSDVTLRTPVYRPRGVIATLIMTLAAVLSARRQLARITGRYRRQLPVDLPNHLRQDIGLPPLPPRSPGWWELRP